MSAAINAVGEPDVRSEWLVAVTAELKLIHPAEASAVVLSYFYEMTPSMIANELGVTEAEVAHLMSQGLAQLGRALVTQDADLIIFPSGARRPSIRRRHALEETQSIEISIASPISQPTRRGG